MRALANIEVKGDLWPKASSVCWRTLPPLIKALCRTGIVPKAFITTGKHWDPSFLKGKVLDVLNLGFQCGTERRTFGMFGLLF